MNLGTADMPRRPAYSYRRCSAAKQGKGRSLERQDFAAQVCDQFGWNLNTRLKLIDKGLSGFTGENRMVGALGLFLRLVKEETVKPGSVLIIEDIDRFSREVVFDVLTVWMNLLGAGIGIYVQTFGMEFSRESINENPVQLYLAIGSMMRAHAESARKSNLLKDVWEARREHARSGRKPMGGYCRAYMRLDKEAGCYRLIPAREAVMRRVIRQVLDGQGLGSIADQLEAEGVERWGRGRRWDKTYLHKLLVSRVMVGEWQPRRRLGKRKDQVAGDPIPGYYPALLTEAEHARLLAGLRARKKEVGGRREGEINLFTGLLYSPVHECNFAVARRLKGGILYTYLSPRLPDRSAQAKAAVVRQEVVEEVVLGYFRELTVEDVTGVREASEAEGLRAELGANEHRLADIETKLVEGIGDSDTLSRASTRIGQRVRDLRRQLSEAESRNVAAGSLNLRQMQSVLAALKEAPAEEARAMRVRCRARIKEIVDRIDLVVTRQDNSHRHCEATFHFRGGATRAVWFDVVAGKLARHGWLAAPEGMPLADYEAT